MSKQRQTQHKAQREEKRARELVDLKRDNQKLQRQVARLHREIAKQEAAVVEESPEPIRVDVTVQANTANCPLCAGPLKEVKLGPGTWLVCPACQYRRKK